MRFDIYPILQSNQNIVKTVKEIKNIKLDRIYKIKTYWIESESLSDDEREKVEMLLRNPIDERLLYKELNLNELDFNYCAQVSFRPGVTDNSARAALEAIEDIIPNKKFKVATGELYFIKSGLNFEVVKNELGSFFGNSLIQRTDFYQKFQLEDYIPSPNFPDVNLFPKNVETIDLNIDNSELEELSRKNLWALSLEELKVIKDYYQEQNTISLRQGIGLPKEPTDIEMEVLAQTWSEHCKHKIFSANINYREDDKVKIKLGNNKVDGIFKNFIRQGTIDVKEKFEIDWLVSVFTDNAGIVRFDKEIDHCLKVETHNSPSALDPYGGALTGILGVNRDILGCGIGAKPIANTNVLCFAPPHYDKAVLDQLPKKLKHPKTILRGVHKGIEDGGNKSGIPTVNGAIHFHDNYAGKPLVYCGTLGVLPQKINGHDTHLKRHRAGDKIVICGGSVGADGIHGATFSSLELDDNAPSTAVQIGDPFTQKRLTDFQMEARDRNLYNSITDNGAGGLSSSVGEMAEHTNGAYIDLSKVPLKYPGLSPYEIVISESQERMTYSVPKEKLEEFLNLANKRKCNPAVIGEFTDTGRFEIFDDNILLSALDLTFLHEGLPSMDLDAHFKEIKTERPWHGKVEKNYIGNLEDSIKYVLTSPNIQSKKSLVAQFDQEVQGSTITKPFVEGTLHGPSDGAVIWNKIHGGAQDSGVCLSSGLAPQVSHIDTYLMTQYSIDEAIRNAVACGANPSFMALCDNYCWPDPIESKKNPDGSFKLAQLYRSAYALYETAMEYGTPFISGKDSMKNDFIGEAPNGEDIKISVPPTLLVTCIAKVDDVNKVISSQFQKAGHFVYYLGPNDFNEQYFSTLSPEIKELPQINLKENKRRFHLVHELIKDQLIESIHDVSDGGVITAIIESTFSHNLGFKFDKAYLKPSENKYALFFNELSGGFIISVKSENKDCFEKMTFGDARLLGTVDSSGSIDISGELFIKTNDLFQIWSRNDY